MISKRKVVVRPPPPPLFFFLFLWWILVVTVEVDAGSAVAEVAMTVAVGFC